MDLVRALRLASSTNPQPERVIAFAGAGGKTTAMFQLARQLLKERSDAVIITASSHLGIWQPPLADRHVIATQASDLVTSPEAGITLFTGEAEGDRILPLSGQLLQRLYEICARRELPLLIEADGSRQKPLKAPGEHEPPIPEFAELVIITAGLSGLGKPLTPKTVHRAEIFGQLAGLGTGEIITAEALARVLAHPEGGQKNIPARSRRATLLTQAETPELLATGGGMAKALSGGYDSTLIGSLKEGTFQTLERTAGILLAAGRSERLGQPKQLLDWRGEPFVRAVARTALSAGLEPVIVVTGAHAGETEAALQGLGVRRAYNPGWEEGQASSIRRGLEALQKAAGAGSAIFLLVDQPQVTASILGALVEAHAAGLPPILAPLVIDQRANPILFDRLTFPDLMELRGDIGGRGIFHKHRVEYLPWHDDRLLLDVDTPAQYTRLIEDETL